MLCNQAIKEFNQVYKKEFGVELPREKAAEKANELFYLFKKFYSNRSSTCSKEAKTG
jgi:hypothetical protein